LAGEQRNGLILGKPPLESYRPEITSIFRLNGNSTRRPRRESGIDSRKKQKASLAHRSGRWRPL